MVDTHNITSRTQLENTDTNVNSNVQLPVLGVADPTHETIFSSSDSTYGHNDAEHEQHDESMKSDCGCPSQLVESE